MASEIKPGLLVLHGNRLELLGDAVFEWIGGNPLGALEEEIFLVQSNGVAEWLKMTIAQRSGICAATQVELPGRFLWRAYRQVLGRAAVPAQSALDKLPLTWRLMQLLPETSRRAGYEPLKGFLQRGGAERRLQLAQRLADLYDQYQVYRGDWLDAWAAGADILPASGFGSSNAGTPLPADQAWQAALWRELLLPVTAKELASSRPQLHQRFTASLEAGIAPASPVPRRVVVFGMTHLPMQTLQALAALSGRAQVILAVLNPCRYHWADIIEGRELLRAKRRRHPLRDGKELSGVALQEMHAHAHPLLAAWGRQGRDFVRQLDQFDDVQTAQRRIAVPRVDLFDDEPAVGMLQEVQAAIRDLVPLAEHPRQEADPVDRSIVFHIAHSAQREVEILHDQLLELLAQAHSRRPINPRDVVVMVPDIEVFTPAIRSVFGQYARGDSRHIPFDIADLQERGHNPLLGAIEWLLRIADQRCTQSEIRDLLDVPSVASRFGLQPEGLPRLTQWIEGAGVRWGLNESQRSLLGLGACGDMNTWHFGMRRMLLGYASGAEAVPSTDPGLGGRQTDFEGIEPYAEVGGLDASLAGSLGALVDALAAWWMESGSDAAPAQWARRIRQMTEDFVAPTDDEERLTVAALLDSVQRWLQACETAGFDEAIPLSVAREAVLSGLDEPGASHRFRAGGVTFCTLMPMRAIPFEVVCLLGMNDGDYPRRSQRSDFDLMGLPGQSRPGDRSRRDDDRQLMLEALLSARQVFYVSWTGRSLRDNSEQPASVLVSQLRDYLAAGWRGEVLEQRTTEHPMQPFSRRYFEVSDPVGAQGSTLFTHAREWRVAHDALPQKALATQEPPDPRFVPDPAVPLTVALLVRFLKNPVKEFFRRRLDVTYRDEADTADDDEIFQLGTLEQYQLLDTVTRELVECMSADDRVAADTGVTPVGFDLRQQVRAQVARLRRAGALPLAEMGLRVEAEMVETVVPVLDAWTQLLPRISTTVAKEPLSFVCDDIRVQDWLDGLRTDPGQPEERFRRDLTASKLSDAQGKSVRTGKLFDAWVRSLLASACGVPFTTVIVGRDATVTLPSPSRSQAAEVLADLVRAWREGMSEPLPLACETALSAVRGEKDTAAVYEGGRYSRTGELGEVKDACLARMYPSFEALSADGRFTELALRVYGPIEHWAGTTSSVELHPAGDGNGSGSGNGEASAHE
jgi:exodeoxyribonuclease V gamma subunit